jgi:hypothetical protein
VYDERENLASNQRSSYGPPIAFDYVADLCKIRGGLHHVSTTVASFGTEL